MNQESWTTAHVNAYKYFGGVTRIIQCDNLKTGVQKHGKVEVVLNKSYQELAEHYGTAILPARVRAPKNKAAVEGTVGIISTFILAALRNRQFLSLLELNEAIWDRLEAFNHKPFQKREGSRASSFAEERPFLRPLPPRPFELATWKVATVGPNYHISVERMNYSVPIPGCTDGLTNTARSRSICRQSTRSMSSGTVNGSFTGPVRSAATRRSLSGLFSAATK